MQCCLRGKSDKRKMISGLLKSAEKFSLQGEEYFLKGIKISDGIYTYLLLKHNSDMENEKKELLFS